ncbi:MAG: dicarboxylate/amino acid:cation symporter [Chlorobi bacterium]|nr:dicarboxylate/amino acid:cation symporter [Chlorobiota bacterium]
MKKIKLHWQILIALVLSIFFGLFFPDAVSYVSWMGTIFLNALKMIIIPLILSSIVSGVANIGGASDFGRLGVKTLGYYVLTSLLAIITGLVFVNLFQPGVGVDLGLTQTVEGLAKAKDSFGGTLMKIIPKNIFNAFSDGNMLGIIFFAMILGFFITKVETKYSALLTDFFNAFFEVMMKITSFIIKFTPLGIFGIVSKVVADQTARGNMGDLISGLGLYMLTVILALFTHAFLTLPAMMKFIAKVNPVKHARNMAAPLLTAFSTASSSATLPLTMEAVEHNSGVSNKITSFVLPLGATVNMDGTALYELVAAIFIAQAYGLDIPILHQFMMVFAALLASIGAAGIPMAGLVMITVVLSVVGLPLEGVGLILAVDRILDMMRTTVNVWSDSTCAVIIAKSENEKINV